MDRTRTRCSYSWETTVSYLTLKPTLPKWSLGTSLSSSSIQKAKWLDSFRQLWRLKRCWPSFKTTSRNEEWRWKTGIMNRKSETLKVFLRNDLVYASSYYILTSPSKIEACLSSHPHFWALPPFPSSILDKSSHQRLIFNLTAIIDIIKQDISRVWIILLFY